MRRATRSTFRTSNLFHEGFCLKWVAANRANKNLTDSKPSSELIRANGNSKYKGALYAIKISIRSSDCGNVPHGGLGHWLARGNHFVSPIIRTAQPLFTGDSWVKQQIELYAGGNSIPFSKCRVTCAYEAACGSCVTITMVLWKSSFNRFRISKTSVAE